MKKFFLLLLCASFTLATFGCSQGVSSNSSSSASPQSSLGASSIPSNISSLPPETSSSTNTPVDIILADGSKQTSVSLGDTFEGWTVGDLKISTGLNSPEDSSSRVQEDLITSLNITFDGKVELSGELIFYKNDDMGPTIYFVPDAASLSKIPIPVILYSDLLESDKAIEQFININASDAAFAIINSDSNSGKLQNCTIEVSSFNCFIIFDAEFGMTLELSSMVNQGTYLPE